jgi:hypothetical protein
MKHFNQHYYQHLLVLQLVLSLTTTTVVVVVAAAAAAAPPPPPPEAQLPTGCLSSDHLLLRRLDSSPEKRSATTTRHAYHRFSPRHTADAEFRNNSLSTGAPSLEYSHEELLRILPNVRLLFMYINFSQPVFFSFIFY